MMIEEFISGRHLRLWPLVLLCLIGCGAETEQGPDVYPVQGKLLVNGEPAAGALVSFHPVDGGDFDEQGTRPWAKVREDGTFEVTTYQEGDGAPEGEYAVSIMWRENPLPPKPSPDKLGGRFANPDRSKFHVTIQPGDNQLEPFEIDGVPAKTVR